MEDEVLMADRPAIIKIICQVDKSKNYVKECSSFKRKKVKSKYLIKCSFNLNLYIVNYLRSVSKSKEELLRASPKFISRQHKQLGSKLFR